MIAGGSLFPAIPLKSSLVELDFSQNADTFSPGGDFDLGVNCTLVGIVNQTNNTIPTLLTGPDRIATAPVEIRDVHLRFNSGLIGDFFEAEPSNLTLSGSTFIEDAGIASRLYTVTLGSSILRLKDQAELATATGSYVHVDVGGNLTVYVEDFAGLSSGAISVATGGACTIHASPTADIDNFFVDNPDFVLFWVPAGSPTGNLTFQPGGSSAVNVYTTEDVAEAVALAIQGPLDVFFDTSHVSDSYTFIANVDFGPDRSWIGVTNQSNGSAAGLVLATQITETPVVLDQLFLTGTFAGTIIPTPPQVLTVKGGTGILCNAGTLLFDLAVGMFIDLREDASLGDGTNPVIHIQTGVTLTILVGPCSFGGIQANSIAIDAGGSLHVTVQPGGFIDDSFIGLTGVTITNEHLRTPMVIGNGGSTAAPVGGFTAGDGTIASGDNAMVLGPNNLGAGQSSTTTGNGCANHHDNAFMHNESGIVEYAAESVNGGTQTLETQFASGVTFVTDANKAYSGTFRVVASRAAGAGTPGVWVYELVFQNVAGTVTLSNQLLTSDVTLQNTNAYVIAFSVVGTEIHATFTGTVAQTVNAVARFDWVETPL